MKSVVMLFTNKTKTSSEEYVYPKIDKVKVDFFCVGVMYSGEYDVCDVTLSVYPHRASFKNMPGHGGNRKLKLPSKVFPILCAVRGFLKQSFRRS
jgi:hypothetical protein